MAHLERAPGQFLLFPFNAGLPWARESLGRYSSRHLYWRRGSSNQCNPPPVLDLRKRLGYMAVLSPLYWVVWVSCSSWSMMACRTRLQWAGFNGVCRWAMAKGAICVFQLHAYWVTALFHLLGFQGCPNCSRDSCAPRFPGISWDCSRYCLHCEREQNLALKGLWKNWNFNAGWWEKLPLLQEEKTTVCLWVQRKVWGKRQIIVQQLENWRWWGWFKTYGSLG